MYRANVFKALGNGLPSLKADIIANQFGEKRKLIQTCRTFHSVKQM